MKGSMMRMHALIIGLLVLLVFGAACESDETTTCNPEVENNPLVLHSGPGAEDTVTAIWGSLEDGSVYAQFGDPQGFADLSTAQLSIEQVRVVSVLGRDYFGYDDMGGTCNNTGADYETELPFDVLGMLPSELGGFSNMVVSHHDGFVDFSRLFCFSEWCNTGFLHVELLTTSADEFGPSVEGGCTTSMALVGVYPPLREPASDIIITKLLLEFINVELMIFDSSGNSVSAIWPSLKVQYAHPHEIESVRNI